MRRSVFVTSICGCFVDRCYTRSPAALKRSATVDLFFLAFASETNASDPIIGSQNDTKRFWGKLTALPNLAEITNIKFRLLLGVVRKCVLRELLPYPVGLGSRLLSVRSRNRQLGK